MKVLFLAHRIPFPPNKGDKIRSFNVLRYLAARHEVSVGCLVDDEADLRYLPQLRSLVKTVAFDRVRPRLAQLAALPGMVRSRALSVSYFHSRRLQEAVDSLLAAGDIGAIFCSSSPMAEYLFRSSQPAQVAAAARVMDLIDVDSEKWRQYAESRPPWAAWIYRYEARCLAAYEERILRAFDRVLVVSEAEKRQIPPHLQLPNLRSMPNGVDLEYFSPGHARRYPTSGPTLVFTGVMDYWPNVDGVEWFVNRIFPRIRAAVPDVRVLIVGNRPTAQVRKLAATAGVTVTGFVEDVRDYVNAAQVCIVPLRIARGIQNKLLEAMAMGKAVISTPQAFEGLRAQAGRDVLVAEDEASFADTAVQLLADEQRRAQLGRNARECVERHYAWAASLRDLDDLIRPDAGQRLQPKWAT
ncbi:MAG TPA: TIGR03087 family PEP-CTERM/XrtA system glycosyltransferase [Steroidobacteraceae bacterium]|nr:TIGR03087 family PEP-CTERM/XrtA system glycosyltransferase [Steroidobacteraceae bacterium]